MVYWKAGILPCWVFAVLLPASIHGAVLSIDVGTEWLKIVLVKPGVPFDLVLNKSSRRKTQAALAFKDSERLYGVDAYNSASRLPSAAFFGLKGILSCTEEDSQQAKRYLELNSNDVVIHPERMVLSIKHQETTYSVEELLAMQLRHLKRDAEKLAGERVSDVVMTVPPFFSELQKFGLIDTAKLAGLNVLRLVGDTSAVAVNYAMTREFDLEPEYHAFLDMGSGNTVVSIVQFLSVPESTTDTGKNATRIAVLGSAWDGTIGGLQVDILLRDHLFDVARKQLELKDDGDREKAARIKAKLLKEANRAKHVLSANADAIVSVENLADGRDFRSKVSREELEELCRDLPSSLEKVVYNALDKSGISKELIKTVVLAGGATRMPLVQTVLRSVFGEEKLAHHVNADEAAVVGSAYIGAGLNRQFRTRDMTVQDVIPYAIQLSYVQHGEPALLKLFDEKSQLGTTKVVTFSKSEDFSFTATADGKNEILSVLIEGIEALKEKGEIVEDTANVEVSITLNESGLLEIGSVHVEKTGFPESTSSTTASSSTPPTPKTVRVPLNFTLTQLGARRLTEPMIKKALERMEFMDKLDEEKCAKEEAYNDLESSIYRASEKLGEESSTTYLSREQLLAAELQVNAATEWLEEHGDRATADELSNQRDKVIEAIKPLELREKEHKHRPRLIKRLRESLESLRNLYSSFVPSDTKVEENKESSAAGPHTAYKATIGQVEKWLKEKVTEQEALPLNVDPVLLSEELEEKLKSLEMLRNAFSDLKTLMETYSRLAKGKENGEPVGEDGQQSPENPESMASSSLETFTSTEVAFDGTTAPSTSSYSPTTTATAPYEKEEL